MLFLSNTARINHPRKISNSSISTMLPSNFQHSLHSDCSHFAAEDPEHGRTRAIQNIMSACSSERPSAVVKTKPSTPRHAKKRPLAHGEFCGVSVNGFHPQLNAQPNPLPALATPPDWLNLEDGDSFEKQDHPGNSRVRVNGTEQERAANVSRVVDSFRRNIGCRRSGWRTEMKKKMKRLSECDGYASHVIASKVKKQKSVVDDASWAKMFVMEPLKNDPKDVSNSFSSNTASTRCTSLAGTSCLKHNVTHTQGECSRKAIEVDSGDYTNHLYVHSQLNESQKVRYGSVSGTTTKGAVRDHSNLKSTFSSDYEDVFLRSCVPQCIANTSGILISWNDAFLQTTGYDEKEMTLTIFSIVQVNRLSGLFDFVAKTIRSASDTILRRKSLNTASSLPFSGGTGGGQEGVRWTSTFPCVTFPGQSIPRAICDRNNPLQVTITLMNDVDPMKRCFYCVLSQLDPSQKQ